jgi:general secretion pathway protein L
MKSIMLKSLGKAQTIFSLWMDSVAQTAADAVERLASPLKVSLIEGEHGELLLQAGAQGPDQNVSLTPEQIATGDLAAIRADLASALRDSCVDVVLRPDHFLFRPLELPNRATEFLGGIVRSQLDRLMPWNAANTAYGWSKPTETGGDRMTITVAATSVEVIKPLRRTLVDAGAHSIRISVAPPEPAADSILIWEEKTQGQSQARQIRRVLVAIIAAVGVAAVLAVGSWGLVVTKFESEQSRLAHEITEARNKGAKLRYAQLGEGKADQTIAARKQNSPSAVLIIEALSKILSDQTYVTELRIDGSKLYLTGVTRDAPSLIETLETSGRFTHAKFFAPTTRSQSDAIERFHIEATIDPISWPQS